MTVPISDAICELQQIDYEQHLIRERIVRIDLEKQRLQQLLTILQSTKITSKTTNVKQCLYEFDSTDSDSEYDSSD